MGDLIHKLPMDEIQVTIEEKDGLKMLFGNAPPPPAPIPAPPAAAPPSPPMPPAASVVAPAPPPETVTESTYTRMSKELMVILLTAGIFFLFSIPMIDGVLNTFIPLCKNSWIVRNSVKAVIFGLIVWIFVNRNYL